MQVAYCMNLLKTIPGVIRYLSLLVLPRIAYIMGRFVHATSYYWTFSSSNQSFRYTIEVNP